MLNSLLGKLISGAVFNVLNIVIQVVLGLFVFREMLSFFGNENFGLWSVIMALLAHVSLFEFGLGALISRQVALIDDVEKKNKNIISTAFISLISLGALFLFFFTIASIGYSFSNYSQYFTDGTSIQLIATLLAINFLLSFISGSLQAYLIGNFYVKSVNTIRLGVNLFRSLGIIIFLNIYGGIIGVAIIFMISAMIEIFARFYYSVKAGILDEVNLKYVDHASFLYLKEKGKKFMFLRLSDYVRSNAGILMSTLVLGPLSVIPLRIAGRLMEIFVEVLSSVNFLLTPYFSKFLNEKSSDFNNKFLLSIIVASSVSLIIYFNILAHGKWFLSLWLGDVPSFTFEALLILSIGFSIANMQGPVASMFVAKEYHKEIAFLAKFEMLITLVSMYILLNIYGVIGAAYAITFSLVLVRGGAQSFIACKLLCIPLKKYILTTFALIINFGLLFYLIEYVSNFISQYFTINYIVTYIVIEAFIFSSTGVLIYFKIKKSNEK